MDWFSEHPDGGQMVLTCGALLVAAIFLWLQRRKLAIAIPCAFIFLLLAAIAIPNVIPARTMARRATCINNLKQIQNAKEQWARENHKLPADIPIEEDLYGVNGTNSFLRHLLNCPSDGKYNFGAVNENPTCSLASRGHIFK